MRPILSFIAAFFIAFGLSCVLSLYNDSSLSGNDVFCRIPALHKQTFNGVLIGSSFTKWNINHEVLNEHLENCNVKFVNLGADGHFPPFTYSMLSRFLDDPGTSNIDYVVLEVENLRLEDDKHIDQPVLYSVWGAKDYFTLMGALRHEEDPFKTVQYFRSYSLAILNRLAYQKKVFDNRCYKDNFEFIPLDSSGISWENHENFRRVHTTDTLMIPPRVINTDIQNDLLEELFAKCQKRGIKLILHVKPFSVFSSSLPDVDIIKMDDFNETYALTKTHFDLGHLNAKGSNLYAKALGNKIEALICARNVSR